MRPDTLTGPVVAGGCPNITINPAVAKRSSINAPDLCSRCSETIFTPLTWSHLRGETLSPAVPDEANADFHIMSDLDFVVKMFNARAPRTHKRSPMIDIKIAPQDIIQSRDRSCGFCRTVALLDEDCSILSKSDGEKVVLRMQAFWPKKSNGIVYPMLLEIGLHSGMQGGGNTGLLALINEERAATDTAETPNPGSIQTLLNALFSEIKKWLQQCQRTHAKCINTRGQQYPTRVLDVARIVDQEQVKLAKFDEIYGDQYAILSYVWGNSATLRLLQATESDFLAGIKIDQFPETIREAAIAADALDIRYLWIDSLCIIQDSELDKSYEIPRMADYYRNASIVISATGATDVHAGFLRFQESGSQYYARVKNPSPHLQSVFGVPFRLPVYLSDTSANWFVDPIPRMYSYRRQPINKRAWTLQESILPRRLLSFPATGGVSMQCLEGELLAGEIISNPHDEAPRYASLGTISIVEKTDEKLSQLWSELIEDYTMRSLTHQSDILVAIGALAREFYANHGAVLGEYMAGLWKNHLREELLWHTSITADRQPTMPQTFMATSSDFDLCQSQQSQGWYGHAPSWSWAACARPVFFNNKPEMYLPAAVPSEEYDRMFIPRWYCEILDCDVKHVSELDLFGAVSAGILSIRGPLRRVWPHRTDDSTEKGSDEKEIGASQKDGSVTLSSASDGTVMAPKPILEGMSNWQRDPETFALDLSASLDWSNDRQYYWLGIWYAGRGRARGLLIEKINETDFRRLGFAEYHVSEDDFPESKLHQEPIVRLM